MKETISTLLCTVLLGLLVSCGGSPKRQAASSETATATVQAKAHRINVPQPPVALSSDSLRLDFVAEHYWDNFDFADTTWIADTAALETAFYGWTGLLVRQPQTRAAQLTGALIPKAEACPAMLIRLSEVAEYYFQHPNSPFRNEELYIPVLRAVIAAANLDDIYKIRPRAQLEQALKNRPGMVAADFSYTTGSGRTGRLSGMRAEYTLLLFYNPGCHDCERVERYVVGSSVFAPLIASGALKVLAVYADEDFTAWREHLPQMPTGWTVGYDPTRTITEKQLYALPAIPNLYLLDKQKRVVLKDAPVEQIEAWLAASQQQTPSR